VCDWPSPGKRARNQRSRNEDQQRGGWPPLNAIQIVEASVAAEILRVSIIVERIGTVGLIILILVLMLLFGGGGFYYGGPYVGGGLGTVLLIVLIVLLVRG
jgi:hypothetical protein